MLAAAALLPIRTLKLGPVGFRIGITKAEVSDQLPGLRHGKDLADAVEPVNDSYKASLEKLLKRANAEGDKGTAGKIQFELKTLAEAAVNRKAAAREHEEKSEVVALREQLVSTKWRINQSKTFTLLKDGSTNSNWTPRKGRWKVLDETTIELDINNVPGKSKVTVSQGATFMTWQSREVDQAHSQTARKIVPIADR